MTLLSGACSVSSLMQGSSKQKTKASNGVAFPVDRTIKFNHSLHSLCPLAYRPIILFLIELIINVSIHHSDS